MEFSTSQKGKRVLVYSGFEYLHFRTRDGIDTWRCRENRQTKCHSFMKTKNNNIVQEPNSHCHDSCPQKAKANIAKSQMKEAMTAVSATSRNVIGETLSKVSKDTLAYLPKQSSLARTLRNHRADKHLPNPSTINFAIPEKYLDLVLYDMGLDDPNRILVLGDQELLSQLSQTMLFGDETFDKAPNMFYQLYTVHAKVGNPYPHRPYPYVCIYCLQKRMKQHTWRCLIF